MKHDIYSILGNPVRSKLIICLSQKPKNVTELIATCGLSQSAISQHLSKLRMAGLVSTNKSGKCVTYELKYKTAAEISQLLSKLQQEML